MSGSTRVAAIRLSTEDLDAARGKFEALGSLGDQVLDRITQAGQRASAAMSGIAGPEDAFARRAADIAAYGAGLDRLQASFNPLFGNMRRYETTLADIARAERVGAIASGEAVVARQRAFASYEQQISANAGLAESYSQLGIAMVRLVDVQQAANRGAGVAAPLAGEALAARGADVAAYGAELDRLRAKFDPLFAVSRTYETTLAEIAQAERVGAISATVAARAREAATKAFADAAAPTGVAASATAVLAGKTVEAAKQQEALGVSTGANAFALRQLGVQTMQAVSSIAAGQPVMMTMIQQGHQVADVAMSTGTGFGVLGTAARMVAGALLSPIGAAVAVGGAFALAMAHAAALETEARQLSVALRAVGRDGDLATASLQGYIVTLQHAGVARDAAASIVQGLARVPALGNAQIQQVVGLTADTTAALGGTDQAAVAKRLGEIASGSYTALKSLDDELNLLTADQRVAIRVMLEHGERTEAVAKAMEALRLRVHGLDQDALSPAAKAVRALGNEWSTLMDRIAQSGPIQAALVVLTAVGAAANKLLEEEPPVATIDRRVGQIDTKLAERDSYGAPVVTGDAERILRQQRADLLAMRMLAGGQVQGGAAAAPEPPAPPAGAIGAAEAERQKKQLEDINKALADQQRILAAGLPDRVRVKAEIEAEAYIREHALTGLAAEEYRRKAVTLALASETDAR
ncbi:MAG: phage tail length tape measure family protein, partial [Burkholderiales bacterium]|nr:phage tail length tape measure family protein [Burkholderiales bacterium]